MIIVTSGARYIDIDAYACCVAYAELLNVLKRPAIAASTAVWNESVSPSIRKLDAPLTTDYHAQPGDQFVVADLSDPERFDELVGSNPVIELFDHHPGFEKYWNERLGEGSHIEFIGAAATLIYEQWVKAHVIKQMSRRSAELLAAAILDNTLNFRASVTTDRDKLAYAFLSKHADLQDAWVERYFTECQESILADLPESLRNDTKFLKFKGLRGELCLGQMVVWDGRDIVASEVAVIASTLGSMSTQWMANVVSISEGKSYFVAQDGIVKSWAESLLHVAFDGSVAAANRLWLRKEVMKADLA